MITAQASIAAACYALIILTTRLTGKERLGAKALGAASAAVAAFVGVCIINCYVSGGCGLLAWAFAGLLVLATLASLGLAYGDVRAETLIVREPSRDSPVPYGATPP